jgi:hypothetical protein
VKIFDEREQGQLFTVSSALFKGKPLLPAYELLIVHERGTPSDDEDPEHWWLLYE